MCTPTQAGIRQQWESDRTPWPEAYGNMLGTFIICALLEGCLAVLPPHVLRRMFPTFISGIAVILIGMGLTGSGIKYWGGGALCGDFFRGMPAPGGQTCTWTNGITGKAVTGAQQQQQDWGQDSGQQGSAGRSTCLPPLCT